MQVALSIAGSDPTGGAGLQADLQVFRSFGVHGAGVMTAVTIQDTSKVHRVLPAFPSVVSDQLRVLFQDLRPDAIKLGMLASDDVCIQVELALRPLRGAVPLVIDPILNASSGTALLERRAWARLIELCADAALVTPNLPEAQALTKIDVSTQEGIHAAATVFLSDFRARAVLVKGGHRDGPPDDLFALRRGATIEFQWLRGERIDAGPVHGTGCALSAAIAAGLARGRPLADAVRAARAFVAAGIARAARPGKGAALLAPALADPS
jgi:hydroxymethylpyrimidine/phosphomethylpyrimidine kinase